MELVGLVITIALLEYMVFTGYVGWARGKFGVNAPAVSGNADFERYYRVQMNTLEQLMVFIPAILLFANYGNATWAAAVGVLFVVGRPLYFLGYVKDPAKRGPGFLLGFAANVILVIGSLVAIIGNLV